jgi:outer membrane protein OmpA-like peptidoglycan-associated protein
MNVLTHLSLAASFTTLIATGAVAQNDTSSNQTFDEACLATGTDCPPQQIDENGNLIIGEPLASEQDIIPSEQMAPETFDELEQNVLTPEAQQMPLTEETVIPLGEDLFSNPQVEPLTEERNIPTPIGPEEFIEQDTQIIEEPVIEEMPQNIPVQEQPVQEEIFETEPLAQEPVQPDVFYTDPQNIENDTAPLNEEEIFVPNAQTNFPENQNSEIFEQEPVTEESQPDTFYTEPKNIQNETPLQEGEETFTPAPGDVFQENQNTETFETEPATEDSAQPTQPDVFYTEPEVVEENQAIEGTEPSEPVQQNSEEQPAQPAQHNAEPMPVQQAPAQQQPEQVNSAPALSEPAPTAAAAPEEQAPAVDTTVREEILQNQDVQTSVTTLEKALVSVPVAVMGQDSPQQPKGTTTQNVIVSRAANEEFSGTVLSNSGNGQARNKDSEKAQANERRARLEGVGLGAIAGLAVGAILFDKDEVVATTPERIVVVNRETNVYQIWRDDDAVLRQNGATEQRTVYTDGSSLSILTYPNNVRLETIRDATGRVLRRDRIDTYGRVTVLDDTRPTQPIIIQQLPAPRVPTVRLAPGVDPVFGAALLQSSATQVSRTFSLAQVRDTQQVRVLAPIMSTDPILFNSGASALATSQAGALSGVASVMIELIRQNPREVFLIEGHTDAVGSAGSNLALSDRRAETIAQALVDYFGVPAENLVFQGYGEALLAVNTLNDEPLNRRVNIRRITPLLHAKTQ